MGSKSFLGERWISVTFQFVFAYSLKCWGTVSFILSQNNLCCQGLEFQSKFIAECIDEIKQELRNGDLAVKANAVNKLTYVSWNLRCNMTWLFEPQPSPDRFYFSKTRHGIIRDIDTDIDLIPSLFHCEFFQLTTEFLIRLVFVTSISKYHPLSISDEWKGLQKCCLKVYMCLWFCLPLSLYDSFIVLHFLMVQLPLKQKVWVKWVQ